MFVTYGKSIACLIGPMGDAPLPANQNCFGRSLAGAWSLAFFLALALFVRPAPSFARDASKNQVDVPLFRHIDPARKDPDFKAYTAIRFVVTDDFPPFSYRTKNGALTGFNIAIANSVCRVLRVECLFKVKPFAQAAQALESNEADALVTGLRQDDRTVQKMTFTRPYYRFSARFAMRKSMPVKASDVRALAGKRLGVVIATPHARFLQENFTTSKIRQFDTTSDAQEGLRTGAIDALFDDSLKLMFWIKGSSSKNCCRFLGDAYLDPETFSRPMAIAVRRENHKLRDLLDHALDRLQISGRYARIYRQYFPLSTWKGGDQDTGAGNSEGGKAKQQGAS